MKKIIKVPFNAALGIATEVLYALFILLAAFLICAAVSFLKI
jgi:hypothetical protein